jgi:hypothetical protein
MYLQYTSDSASSPGIPQWHLSVQPNPPDGTLEALIMSEEHEAAIDRGKEKVDKEKDKKEKAAKDKKGKDKGGKDKKGKKGKKGGPSDGPSVAGHPRASAQVRRAKGFGGVGGFALAAVLGLKAGITPDQIGLRALGAGVAGYLLFWACSVAVWRHLVMAELRALAEQTLAAAEAARGPMVGMHGAEEPAPPPSA